MARKYKIQVDELQEKIEQVQRDSSAQQAKLIISALTNQGESGSPPMDLQMQDSNKDEVAALEKEVSDLTNYNLKLLD